MTDIPVPSSESRGALNAAAADADSGPAARPEPQSVASEAAGEDEAGAVGNPEVPAASGATEPTPPAPTPTLVRGTPPALTATPFVPAPAWDQSGYAPPAAIRLADDASGGGSFTPVGPVVGQISAAAPIAPPAWAPIVTPVSIPIATQVAVVQPTVVAETGRRKKVQLRTSVTIILFLLGVAVGVAAFRVATPPRVQTLDAFPSLERSTAEPPAAGAVAQELVRNDVHGLAQLLDSTTLSAIQTQLKPLVSFESVTFVGATTLQTDTLAGYVVRGRAQDGSLGLVGLVIRIRDGQVVVQ